MRERTRIDASSSDRSIVLKSPPRNADLMLVTGFVRARASHRAARLLCGVALAALPALLAPSASSAMLVTFGSSLSQPASLNTAENLDYEGINTPLPGSVYHTPHFGADTALWNVAKDGNALSVPVDGQALKFSLEGCALPASGGPAPLDQIHFQVLSPVAGGGAKVQLTSQSFTIPICGQGGASGATVSTYEPVNMCVNRGDYLSFNDEGGYVENVYRAGVPYEVLGAAQGSTVDSFIKGNGTGNGAVFSPSETSAGEGFMSNANKELMMQAQIGTGANARYVCPGGSKEAPQVLPVIRISPQTDGVNRERIVEIAIYCRPAGGCPGAATLTASGEGKSAAREVGHTTFDLRGDDTTLMPIRISPRLLTQIRKHDGVATTIAATVNGETFTQTVDIKIF
jgi:hypothetical protein